MLQSQLFVVEIFSSVEIAAKIHGDAAPTDVRW